MTDFTREESWVQHVDDLSADGTFYPHEMVEKLVKAAFAVGFRCGRKVGNPGFREYSIMEAWELDCPKDIFSPEAWENVP